MAKKNDLKNSMSAGLTGGLDSLIQSTAGQKEAQKPKKAKTVHCNFVMDETYHQNLKLIAIRKGDSLKSVLQEAISDYLDKKQSPIIIGLCVHFRTSITFEDTVKIPTHFLTIRGICTF